MRATYLKLFLPLSALMPALAHADAILTPAHGTPAPSQVDLPPATPRSTVVPPAGAITAPQADGLGAVHDAPDFGSVDSSPDAHPEQYARFVAELDTITKSNELNLFPALSIILNTTGDELAVLSWMQKAADAGNPAALHFLSNITQTGSQDPDALKKAYAQARRAADKGYSPAIISAAGCLKFGIGVKADEQAATNYLAKACRGGDFRVRFQWLASTGRLSSIRDAERPEVKSEIERGNHLVAYMLSTLAPTPQERLDWLRRAADLGNDNALVVLADLLSDKDPKSSIALLQMACKSGNREALYTYAGILLEKDPDPALKSTGVSYNEKGGTYLLRLDAMHGHPGALLQLASIYLNGRYGIKQNLEHAYRLFDFGSRFGSPDLVLGKAYCQMRGLGTKQDLKAADKTINQYYEKGHPLACLLKAYEAYKGLGVSASIDDVESFCYEASASGFPLAYLHLACIIAKGMEGVKPDPERAETYVQMAELSLGPAARKIFNRMMQQLEWEPFVI